MHCTVMPVYNDHSKDPVMVVSVDRWSSYRGALVSLRWPMEQSTVVTVDRWSSRQVSLYWNAQTLKVSYSTVAIIHRHACTIHT